MNLFLIQWGKQEGTRFNERSKEFIWTESQAEAQAWGEKLARNTLETKVSPVWAAITTDESLTGIANYEVKQGKQL